MDIELRTPQGVVRGLSRAGHQAFLGIPYAQPPTGERRFAAPAEAPTWSGVRSAQRFGPVAPQTDRGAVTATGEQSEDCLYLNVFTPAADAGRRPVMVWIHGGAFSWGAGSEPTYDGGPLAARGGVVVVTINYRLGALGYLYLDDRDGASWGATSNPGHLDQIAALRWVRDNIAAYGGDPSQVTIFGESAGAVAVCSLLSTPQAQGLFSRAIAQSGTANRLPSPPIASKATQALLESLGLHDQPGAARSGVALGAALRALSVRDLLRAHHHCYVPGDVMFWPAIDGHCIPERPLLAVRAGRARDIPLLIGSNRDETKFYAPAARAALTDDELLVRVAHVLPHSARGREAEVVDTYKRSRKERALPHDNLDVLDALETASRFTVQAARLAQAQAEHQPDTYHYLFDWESPVSRLGSCHALDLPFVFGTLHAAGNDRFAGSGPQAEQLSQQMMDAWVAFAKTGNPSCDALGTWPRYDAVARNTMVLGKHTHVEPAPFEPERALWESLLA